jgi:hypothetical protein
LIGSNRKGSTVADTTAVDGSIDAVAASLYEDPTPNTNDEPDDDLEQSPRDDAQDQSEGDEQGEADDGDALDDDDDRGSDDEGDADAGDDDTSDQLFTVNVDGRTQKVPLAELIRGYSGQSYIQKGMRDVAEARKETAVVYQALQTERQQIAQFIQAAQENQIDLRPPVPPADELLTRDPIGYMEQRLKYDKALVTYQQTQAVRQEMEAKAAEAQSASQRAYLAEQHQQLTRVIPAFAKPETAARVKQELISAGTGYYGYAPEELQSVTDHRALLVLHDAAQYRRLMSGKAAAPKEASAAPRTPTIKAGTRTSVQGGKRVQSEKAKTQMRRTGSVDDVTRYLLS